MSETVWVLGPTKSRSPKGCGITSLRTVRRFGIYRAKPVSERAGKAEGRKPCRGPCARPTKAGLFRGLNRQMVTGGKR